MAVFLTRYHGTCQGFHATPIDHRPILGAGPSAVDQLDKMEHYAMHLLRGRKTKENNSLCLFWPFVKENNVTSIFHAYYIILYSD